MAGIVAYKERETAIGTHLRDEWRLKPFSAYTNEQVTEWLGPHWFSTSYYRNPRFILEHRYIRDGVDEGWKPFDLFPSREAALQSIDRDATPVGKGLAKVKTKRSQEEEQRRADEAAKIAAADAAERRREKEHQSNMAFVRLRESKNAKHAALADAWNTFVETRGNDPALQKAVLADRTLYDAVIGAVTIPAKVKAIKAFLKRYGSASDVAALVGEVKDLLK